MTNYEFTNHHSKEAPVEMRHLHRSMLDRHNIIHYVTGTPQRWGTGQRGLKGEVDKRI